MKLIGRERMRLETELREAEQELQQLERRLSQRPEFGPGMGSGRADSWEMALARRERAEERVAAMQQALQRLQAGAYGRCQRCGAPINPERLQILPATTLCVACARAVMAAPGVPRVAAQSMMRE